MLHVLPHGHGAGGAELIQTLKDGVRQSGQPCQVQRQLLQKIRGLAHQLPEQRSGQGDHRRQQRQCKYRRQKSPLQVHPPPHRFDGRLHQRGKTHGQQEGQQPYQQVPEKHPDQDGNGGVIRRVDQKARLLISQEGRSFRKRGLCFQTGCVTMRKTMWGHLFFMYGR